MRVHTGGDDDAYSCMGWGPDKDGINGVWLRKDVPLQVWSNELGEWHQVVVVLQCVSSSPETVRKASQTACSNSLKSEVHHVHAATT